jgi:hypothetical protein
MELHQSNEVTEVFKVLKAEAGVEEKQSTNTRWCKDNHLALKMKSLEVAHARGKRENACIKQQ